MKKITTAIIIVAVIAVMAIAAGRFIAGSGAAAPFAPQASAPSGAPTADSGVNAAAAPALDASTTARRADESSSLPQEALARSYSNPDYRFSLRYPAGLHVSSFANPSGQGDVVLIADLSTGIGMQIVITPYAGSGGAVSDITPAVIKENIPGVDMVDPQEVTLGSLGRGTAFMDGAGPSASRQVWFAAAGHLYQISAPRDFDATLRNILGTWKFL
ncbi:MAG: hypothetical protein KGK30_04980 [Elusimicrobia bacterium]|nr:hypothetical protein [Elusimicrobiota bacterium]